MVWWGTVPARYGRVTVAIQGEALLVRKERVLFAGVTGRVRPVAQEGERVPRGALVARVLTGQADGREVRRVEAALGEVERRAILDEQSPLVARVGGGGEREGVSAAALAIARRGLEQEREALATQVAGRDQLVRTPLAGTVSYTVDGLEGILGPQSLPDLLKEEVPVEGVARAAEPQVIRAQEAVVPGRPVAKVVDSFQVWFVVDLPREGARLAWPRVGQRVRVRLRGGGAPAGASCRAAVTGRRDRRDGTRLVLAPVEYWPEFGRLRRTTLEVLLAEYEGVWIPRSALVERNGATGVMVENWLGRQFQPVSVLGGDPERVAVDGLSPGSRVWKKGSGNG
jgi:putative membrane fusion protein